MATGLTTVRITQATAILIDTNAVLAEQLAVAVERIIP